MDNKKSKEFIDLEKRILNVKTYRDLGVCYDYLEGNEFSFTPEEHTNLLENIRKKEKEFTHDLSDFLGFKVGKIQ